jgi:DNA-binding response OmpR family regulator
MMERPAPRYRRPALPAAFTPGGSLERTLTIMVVEDDLAVADLLRAVINGTPGWGAIVLHDARDALEVLRYVPVDLLVLDVNLPGMSGPQLLEHLRGELGKETPPAIFVSAGAMPPEIERALQQGVAQRFLAKPFDLDDLVGAMRAAIRPVEVRHSRHVAPRYQAAAYRWGAA